MLEFLLIRIANYDFRHVNEPGEGQTAYVHPVFRRVSKNDSSPTYNFSIK